MVLDTATICDLCDQFPGFAMLPRLARVEASLNATLIPLNVCRPSGDCTCDKPKQRFPNCAHRRDCAESHGQSMLQGPSNKHIDRHLWQKLHDGKVERHVDREFEQIYLVELQMAKKFARQQNVKLRQNLQPLLLCG
jgi:hypothetical protein